jgi:hypothetical protein
MPDALIERGTDIQCILRQRCNRGCSTALPKAHLPATEEVDTQRESLSAIRYPT